MRTNIARLKDWVLIALALLIIIQHGYIQRLSIISALLIILLAFLTIMQQLRGSEMWLHHAQQPESHCHVHQKYTRSP